MMAENKFAPGLRVLLFTSAILFSLMANVSALPVCNPGECCIIMTNPGNCAALSAGNCVLAGCTWTGFSCIGTANTSRCPSFNGNPTPCQALGCRYGPAVGPICEGDSCLNSGTCCPDAPYCTGPVGDGTCATCIPDGDPLNCDSDIDCCTNHCDPASRICGIFTLLLPDYAASISVPATATVGVPFGITVNTTNIGTENAFDPSDTMVDFIGSLSQAVTVDPPLAAGSTQSNGLSFTCVGAGMRTLTVTADFSSDLPESNEINNVFSATVNCLAAPPPPVPTTPFCRSDQFNGILQLCAIAGIGMAALIAFFYMIGEMMQNARMLSWAKTEAMQVFLSLVIAMVILWVLSIFCQIEIGEMTELLGLPGLPAVYATRSDANFYNAGMLYLENLGGAGLANIASLRYNLGAYEIRTSFNNYECDSICLLSLSSTNVAVFGGETSSLALTNNLLSLATISYLSSIFQYFVLLYIMNGLFMVFLPLAMVMRSIPFMRNFGGALIGIFVALYLFYPAMLVFDGFVVPGMTQAIGMSVRMVDRTGSHCGTGDGYNLGLGIFNGSVGCVSGRGEAEFDSTGIFGVQEGDMMDLLPTISHEDGDGNRIVTGVWPPHDVASSIKINVLIFLASVFFPAMNFIVIAALARDLSRFLGEEADISRLGQMV